MGRSYFTSESVTRGHPDKLCDQVADRILDELLAQDPESRVACEVTCATDQLHIFGEITSDAQLDYEEVARQVISEIGYTKAGKSPLDFGFTFGLGAGFLPHLSSEWETHCGRYPKLSTGKPRFCGFYYTGTISSEKCGFYHVLAGPICVLRHHVPPSLCHPLEYGRRCDHGVHPFFYRPQSGPSYCKPFAGEARQTSDFGTPASE